MKYTVGVRLDLIDEFDDIEALDAEEAEYEAVRILLDNIGEWDVEITFSTEQDAEEDCE